MPESMAQYSGFTDMLGKQAHSRLRNWVSSAAVESKETSFLRRQEQVRLGYY